ncbi:7-cyano-7-deazaguanine synthase QueC [Poriferisphaera sp. WC338]|uniref:7-cyano-7-deazaguanine synthase QueC n=1 Tax=Poriferisphaera sp. WC338 TaxID=3425129 RepID=UPI003D81B031
MSHDVQKENVMDGKKKPAVVLLSGGLDSTTCLAIANATGFETHALIVDYGQRHIAELKAADLVAEHLGCASKRTAKIDMRLFGGSALTTDEINVPKDRDEDAVTEIPVTYVPARNTIFMSYALALAEVLESQDIYIGVNALDYSGYPDCRGEYIDAFTKMANLATKAGVEGKAMHIHTPLLMLRKTEIIEQGLALGVDYGLTHSCYDPIADEERAIGYRPCGHCDSCLFRKRAFEKLGTTDPVLKNID